MIGLLAFLARVDVTAPICCIWASSIVEAVAKFGGFCTAGRFLLRV